MAANYPKPVTALEICRVTPPIDTAEQSFPLSFSDVPWLHFLPMQCLLFYAFPCSKTHFLENIVPNLKSSLSQTLKHFFPLAGNVNVPLDSTIPEFLYVPGDSIPVAIAEANQASDFNYLTGYHPRAAEEFYSFFLPLSEPKIDSERGFKSVPLLTVQMTLFPGTGICMGFNCHHVVADASSIVGFINAWSSIFKLKGDDDAEFPAPVYDRSLIKDPSGLKEILWNQWKDTKIESLQMRLPLNKVRATFVLKKEDIQKLRNVVLAKNPTLVHLSSFAIITAYFWSGLAKSTTGSGEEIDDNDVENFAFVVDARPRIDPPVPAAYFGNCHSVGSVKTTHEKLKGEEGFVTAVEMIGDVIRTKINNKDEIFRGAEKWKKLNDMLGRSRLLSVSGSPKFDLYGTDFGWGKPIKYEILAIDENGSMSLGKSREFEGGFEIGLCLPVKKMEAFAAIFYAGLNA